jgi:hypothetical protein
VVPTTRTLLQRGNLGLCRRGRKLLSDAVEHIVARCCRARIEHDLHPANLVQRSMLNLGDTPFTQADQHCALFAAFARMAALQVSRNHDPRFSLIPLETPEWAIDMQVGDVNQPSEGTACVPIAICDALLFSRSSEFDGKR